MAWPTTSDPKTEFVTLRFTLSEAGDLDSAAQAAGLSRSAYVRECVRRVISAEQRKTKRAQKTEAQTGTTDG